MLRRRLRSHNLRRQKPGSEAAGETDDGLAKRRRAEAAYLPGQSPAPVPEFTFPRTPNTNTSWVLEIRTLDGRGLITFSNTVPAGVPPSAFQWEQTGGVSPGTVGRLRYNGCGAGCAASITFQVSVRDSMDFSGGAASGQIKLNLTASNDRPRNVASPAMAGRRFGALHRSLRRRKFKAEIVTSRGYGDLNYRLIPENLTPGP